MFLLDVLDSERGEGDSVFDEGGLEGLGGGVLVGLEQQLDAVGGVGGDDG